VSHTFIRREIRALEARGYSIERFAIRPGGAIADPEDREEFLHTRHIVGRGIRHALRCGAIGLWSMCKHPMGAFRALFLMLAMAAVSDRGMERHMAYMIEAAYLLEIMEEEKLEHVHVHFGTNAAAVARLLKAFGGPNFSMTVHGPDEFDEAATFGLGDKVADSTFTVAITNFCAAQLKLWTAYPEWNKIHVVHCTVGPRWFRDEPINPETKTVVYVGRLAPQKGLPVLLEAYAPVAKADPLRRLVLVGDGDMRPEIEAQIARLGLSQQVMITGFASEALVREHLAGARALVMGSFAEGLPVVIMEAMAMRRPVVATRIMGIPELVREGVDGWLVTPGDIRGLSLAMAEMYDTPVERLDEMGIAAQQQVRKMHTTDTEAKLLDKLFRQYTGHTDDAGAAHA
jgi:glycosyltransferase involved in cell wall biosynthesis